MAEKEASVFVVDLGRSMGAKRSGRNESDLDYSLRYFWDKLANIVYLDRKGLVAGVVGFRTDGTQNHLQDDDGYDNITVIQSLQNVLMPELKRLPRELKSSQTDSGDALSAVILGVDLLKKHCRHLKFTKKLYLITNGTGPLDADDIEQTAAQIKQDGIQLIVLGVDFDDAEYGFKEEGKSFNKQENEAALQRLTELSDGTYATMAEAIEGLHRPFLKLTKPIPSYKGQLRLGDPEVYDTAITIDVERYPKVSIRKAPSASAYVHREGGLTQQQTEEDNFASVRSDYAYKVADDTAEGGLKDVPKDDLARGYEYGRTAVHISKTDENITKLETKMAYEILGFIPQENVERYTFLGPTHMLVAQKLNDKAAYALSSLIHALFEVGSVAVARFIRKDMLEPQLTMLSPLIDSEVECLIENDLPFAEDLRIYRFPPVDKILTVSGKSLGSHRNLPSDDLMTAMSSYMDSMSLVNDSTSEERFAIDDVYSPLLHTIEDVIKRRAVYPDEPVPVKAGILLEPSEPPSEIRERSRNTLGLLVAAADVKKVPPRVKGRARYRDREADKPVSGLDVDALLQKSSSSQIGGKSSKTVRIDHKNAIPEFKRLFYSGSDEVLLTEAAKQMGEIVQDLVRTSMGDSKYDQAIEILGVVRRELLDFEFAKIYNELLVTFKERLANGDLDGDRKDFWWRLRVGKLGPIDQETVDGGMSPEEVRTFFRLPKSSAV